MSDNLVVVCQQPQQTSSSSSIMSTTSRDKLILLFLINYAATILCTHCSHSSTFLILTSNIHSLRFNPTIPSNYRSRFPSFYTTMVQGLFQWSARNNTTTLVPLLLPDRALLPTPCCALVHLGACNQFTKGPCSLIGLVCGLRRHYSYLSIRVLSQPTYERDWENKVNLYVWALWANL